MGYQITMMKYSQYKKHYADCKTVPGSYNKEHKVIDVIIPDGRMKKSGVRGEKFYTYRFDFTDGTYTTYLAVSMGNALKRVLKDFPDKQLAREY